MALSEVPQCQPGEDFDFLCVNDFLTNMVAAQALKSALALRLIDQLGAEQPSTLARLEPTWRGDRRGLRLLLDLLAANQVVERIGDEIRLTPRFRGALRFRDLLEAKLDFANLVAPDLIQFFPWLFVDPDRFMQKARIFNLFDYSRCLEPSPENYEATKRWMRFTTCLTRYEAPACMRFHDFSRYARMLDVGGEQRRVHPAGLQEAPRSPRHGLRPSRGLRHRTGTRPPRAGGPQDRLRQGERAGRSPANGL